MPHTSAVEPEWIQDTGVPSLFILTELHEYGNITAERLGQAGSYMLASWWTTGKRSIKDNDLAKNWQMFVFVYCTFAKTKQEYDLQKPLWWKLDLNQHSRSWSSHTTHQNRHSNSAPRFCLLAHFTLKTSSPLHIYKLIFVLPPHYKTLSHATILKLHYKQYSPANKSWYNCYLTNLSPKSESNRILKLSQACIARIKAIEILKFLMQSPLPVIPQQPPRSQKFPVKRR